MQFVDGALTREKLVGEVVDLIDNVFIFHVSVFPLPLSQLQGDATLYVSLAIFLWKYLAQYNATFLDVCQRLAADASELDKSASDPHYWAGALND